MKRFKFLTMTLLLFTVLTSFSFGQNSWENTTASDATFQQTILSVDSANTTSGGWFSLEKYLGTNWDSYPASIELTASVPTTGVKKVVLYLQSSFDKTTGFANIDTIASSDSLLSTTGARVYANYNNRKYPFYRWQAKGQSTNTDSVTVTVKQFILNP